MNTMKHRGYTARVEFDAEDRIFVGRVIGIMDIVSFHGETVSELENAFREAVDDYLDACASLGQQPNKQVMQKKQCGACGGKNMVFDTRDLETAYKGSTITITAMPGWYCQDCGDGEFVSAADVDRFANETAEAMRAINAALHD